MWVFINFSQIVEMWRKKPYTGSSKTVKMLNQLETEAESWREKQLTCTAIL